METQESGEGANARRFLDAFADIEQELRRQALSRDHARERPTFWQLLDACVDLTPSQRDALRLFGNLRNAISHSRYHGGEPIADPRTDTVKEIEHLRDLVLEPPLLVDALQQHGRPRVFSLEDDITEFLRVVTERDFSQAPVSLGDGQFALITTNAVARWFAEGLDTEGGVVDSAPIGHVLRFAEHGDRLQRVAPDTSSAWAINIFSGQSSPHDEPPAALLVMGLPGQPPRCLAVRSDLVLLYAHIASR